MQRFPQINPVSPGDKQKTIPLEYVTITDIDLTVAHTDQEYDLPGIFDTLVVQSLKGVLSIKLNSTNRGSIDLSRCPVVNAPFDKFFYTNVAQSLGAVTLLVGGEASFGVAGMGVRPATFPPGPLAFCGSANQVTTAAYAVYGVSPAYWTTIVKGTIVLRETGGANGALYWVQGTLDGTNWVTLKKDQPLIASGIVYETITDLWAQLQIQIIDAIAASHATVEIKEYYESLL